MCVMWMGGNVFVLVINCLYICNSYRQQKILENMGRIDEQACDVNIINPIGNSSNVEIIHVQCGGNILEKIELHLVVIDVQVWNGHHIIRPQFVGFYLLSTTCWPWESTNDVVYHMQVSTSLW